MAEIDTTFNYDADFSSAISEVKRLAQELSVLNSSFNSLDKNARKLRDDIASTFVAGVGDLGAFSTKVVDISSSMDHFGKSLDQGKLKLRDYYREATRAFQANSNAHKLAVDQVRRTRSELVQLGIDPTGRNKGILVTPLKLDMSDMNNQLAVARKQFDIFNSLVQGGATKLINFGKNTQWAGRQLTVGITVPMSIFASTVTKAFMDVDAELTRFQKVYGSGLVASTAQSTAQIRGQVQAMATDIAKQYGVAAKETAGLAADLAATGLEGQNLLNSLQQTTRLSVLGEVDRQTAMKATLSLQNAFKVSSKDLADQINFLNAVENQTSTSLVDLTEAIPKAGPVIKALGGDVKDLSLLLVAMKEGGIGVAEGANSIKSGLASLINPTKAAIEVGKQYGINIEDIVKTNKGKLMPTILSFQNALNTLDDFSKAQVIEKIFGKYQFARMSALFDNLNASGSQTKKVLELMSASNSQLAAIANQEIKTLTESSSMRFKRSMEAIRASLLPVGETILKSVLPYLEKFSSFIDKVVSVGKNLPEPIKQFIKFGSAITAIAGPLVMIGGVLANFLGYVTKGAMGFVNLGRRMAGLPTHQFELLTDEQIAAAKATDVLTISIDKQKTAMVGLNALMKDYVATLVAQREATPAAFVGITPTTSVMGKPVVPKGTKTLPVIKRQSGGSAWVPGTGSGDRVPALLEPGEFVINRNAASKHAGLIQDINNGTPRFQSGGLIQRFSEGGKTDFAHVFGSIQRELGPEYLDIGFKVPSSINSALNNGTGVKASDFLELILQANSEKTMERRLNRNGIPLDEARLISIAVKDALVRHLSTLGDAIITDPDLYAATRDLSYKHGDTHKIVADLFNRADYKKQKSIGLTLAKFQEFGAQISDVNWNDAPEEVRSKILTFKGGKESKLKRIEIGGQTFYQGYRTRTSGVDVPVILDSSLRQFRGAADRKRILPNSITSLISHINGIELPERVSASTAERALVPQYRGRMRRLAFQSGGIIHAMSGTKIHAGNWADKAKNPLSLENLIDEWVHNGQGKIRKDLTKFQALTNFMQLIGAGKNLNRGTVLNPAMNKELPIEEQLMLMQAIRSGNFEGLFGKILNFRGLGSFSENAIAESMSGENRWPLGRFLNESASKHASASLVLKDPNNSLYKMFQRTSGVKVGKDGWESVFFNLITGRQSKGLDLGPKQVGDLLHEAILSSPKAVIEAVSSDIKSKHPIFHLKGMQSGGPWVPGSGTGDRVPAMLEPGEFVVNKNAAMKYGGLLHDLNFNQAPRFAEGGGFLATGLGAAGGVGMLYSAAKLFTDSSLSFADKMSQVAQTLAFLPMMLPSLKETGFGSKIMSSKTMTKMKTPLMGAAADAGAFETALMSLTSPLGIAALAVGALGLAVYKYHQEIEKSKKAAQEAFTVGKETAAAYGVEIQNLNDKIKENQEISKATGVGTKQGIINPTGISQDKLDAIKKDNQDLINKLKSGNGTATNAGGMNMSTTSGPTANTGTMLTAKYATLRQQGFDENQAMEVLSGIAKEAGDNALSVLSSLRPQLMKITGNTESAIFKAAQNAQIESLKQISLSGAGGSESFREAFKASVQAIQYAPPADQQQSMSNFIDKLNSLNGVQVQQAGKALVEMANADYGSASTFAQTIANMTKSGKVADLQAAFKLDTAQRLGVDQELIKRITVDFYISPAEQAILDNALSERTKVINIQMSNQEKIQGAIDNLNKKLTAQNAKFDNQMTKQDKAAKKEDDRYKAAAKASAKFVKEKQKEIDAINKGADAYSKALQKESDLSKFRNAQTDTAFGGLSALAQGDVIGFIKSKQDAEQNARQFSTDQELNTIEEKRKAATDFIQEQIDKENEKQANAEEHHQKILDNIEKQRQAYIKSNAAAVQGIQNQIDTYNSLSSTTSSTYKGIVGNLQYVASEGQKAEGVAAALNYLLTHPNGTVQDAINAGNAAVNAKYKAAGGNLAQDAETARENRRVATGGHITGAGGPTDDKIPAMLSNGEYVVRASAVNQYGVGMLDAINTQKYANGGVVRPAAGEITNHYGTRKPYYSKNKDRRGWGEHTGTDFAPGSGSPVLAFEDGTIISAGEDSGWGKHIKMKHSYGPKYSYYAHLSKIIRSSGDVTAGTKIGLVGNTGSYSRGAHLHFETGNNLPYSGTNNPEGYLGMARAIAISGRADKADQQAASKNTENIATIAKAFGTTVDVYNGIKNNGLGSVLTGRRFGGSMTMRKPYMVGENGPEIVVPYGAGSKVMPKFDIASAKALEARGQRQDGIINNAVGGSVHINLSVSGVHDPTMAANLAASKVIHVMNSENQRRKSSRSH